MKTSTKCLARCMPLEAAATILTLAHEPELILEPGEHAPCVPAAFLEAAEFIGRLEKRRMRGEFNGRDTLRNLHRIY